MTELSQLRWRCRRGVKELDVVLNHYLDTFYRTTNEQGEEVINPALDKAEKTAFKELLDLEDPILYAMLLGNIVPEDAAQQRVLAKLGQRFA